MGSGLMTDSMVSHRKWYPIDDIVKYTTVKRSFRDPITVNLTVFVVILDLIWPNPHKFKVKTLKVIDKSHKIGNMLIFLNKSTFSKNKSEWLKTYK